MTPEQMAQIHAACFDGAPRPWTAAEFADYIEGPDALFERGETALAVLRIAADEAEILTIAVDPAQQRRGLASALMAEMIAHAAGAGCTKMLLEVAEPNIAARALYETHGFSPAGYRKNYYHKSGQTALSAVVMVKNLGSAV